MARTRTAADHPYMASGGGRILAVLACMAALAAVAAPAAVSSPSTNRVDTRRARVGRAAAAERDPRRPRPRRAPAEREPQPRRQHSIRGRWPRMGTSTTTRSTGRRSRRGSRTGTRSRGIGAGRSARTCSGRRPASIPSGRSIFGWARPEHRANILNRTLARDRHRRGAQHVSERRLRAICRSRSSRPTSAFAANGGYRSGQGARSSVEERRPSKPLVGGSNPPGRTC